MIFDKDTKTTQWGKDSAGGNWMAICKRMAVDPYLRPYTKINSK